ncbi:MAG: bifunctional [glutamine synthetase] adenylyltransferase/[glutamine synthetase]-adenylyl-L-tyrosine phosphorylase [Acidimicrobiales bacterium]|nr:bifunctional [glutamine synthetase] adenylyltransferase/[glutamine synthetase]-adenylyl-L-tyrosine phosphorylase [Acidimicrobiales bacterium]
MTGGPERHFEEAVEASPVPDLARAGLARTLEAHPEATDRLAADPDLVRALLAVTSASRSLTRHVETDAAALDVLAALDEPVPISAESPERLVASKRLEYLRIAARDLIRIDALEATGAALAALGRDVLAASCTLAEAEHLAVIGMGKLGGDELNYASDIDVMFVGEAEHSAMVKAARNVLDHARRCFRVDANLRPEGRDGPLARTVSSYEAYWDKWAQPWEFQALLKARPVAGDAELGAAYHAAATERLWSRHFSADDLRSVRAMKERAESEIAKKGLSEREVKRGRGGIRDIEFSVQLLQLVHGRLDPELRSPTTLVALGEMADAGYVDQGDADGFAAAYRFLREVEHRLQLVDEQQVHAVPTGDEERSRLARNLGYRSTVEESDLAQLDRDLATHQATARSIHERVYFRPLLEAFAEAASALTDEAIEARLAAFGFTDAARTRQAVSELTRGLTRSSRLMQQVLPLLLDWLSASPDPDVGLLGLRNLASDSARTGRLAATFRESPEVAQRLCQVLGTSRLLGEVLGREPDLVSRLADPTALRTRPRDELVESATKSLEWRADADERQQALRRWRRRHLLGVGARDVMDVDDVRTVGRDLTAIAEATLEAALRSLHPTVPFAVLALGRFGGGELSYASDLDVAFVFDGSSSAAIEEADRLATRLMKFLKGHTPAARIYDVDADLRPEGKQGPLARSLNGYTAYFEHWLQTWERQAWTRARFVAGDEHLGRTLIRLVDPYVWDGGLDAEGVRAVRRMKARVEQERIPPNEDPKFHLKLGRGSLSDVEWTAQLLQLQHGLHSPGTMAALDTLAARDILSPDDADVLREAYAFCERTRNRWFLVHGQPGDALPQQADRLAVLARSLDATGADLRNEYRRVTRKSRAVVERVFYGRG